LPWHDPFADERQTQLDIALHKMSTDGVADIAGRRLYRSAKTDGVLCVSDPDPALSVPDWRDDIFAALKAAGIRQVGYVPDAGHSRLIERCRADPEIRAIVLTSEEEGIGLTAGAWLGGQKAALLMQSSGVGNCINMLSLAKSCRFPLTLLVTMRGEWAEFNPWQVPMGTKTQAALELMDVLVYRVERPEEAGESVAAALDITFNGGPVTAVLLAQRLIGAKRWVK
jgi:sulfopyruvate decarboxylase alpha subunit